MTAKADDRREFRRLQSGRTAALRADDGRVVAEGRVANLSEGGALVIARGKDPPAEGDRLVLEISPGPESVDRPASPPLQYAVRVVRVRSLGALMGIGLSFQDEG